MQFSPSQWVSGSGVLVHAQLLCAEVGSTRFVGTGSLPCSVYASFLFVFVDLLRKVQLVVLICHHVLYDGGSCRCCRCGERESF